MQIGTPTPFKDLTGEYIKVGDIVHSSYGNGCVGIVKKWSKKQIQVMVISPNLWRGLPPQEIEDSLTKRAHRYRSGFTKSIPPAATYILRDLSSTMVVQIARDLIDRSNDAL